MMRLQFRNLVLMAATAAALAGCKGGDVTPPPPPVPPPPPPAPVASITISPASLTLEATKTGTFSATAQDVNGNVLPGRAITWSSDNASVASVNGSGTVTGAAPGSTTIHAQSEGITAPASVTVTRQAFDHVVIVVLENRDFGSVIGNSA